jgi:hypothetical protein
MIRKGRIRGLAKEDPAGQARFVGNPFGIAVQKKEPIFSRTESPSPSLSLHNTTFSDCWVTQDVTAIGLDRQISIRLSK